MTERSYAPLLAIIAALLTAYRLWVIRHLGIDLYVDEAYYWGWSQALDWGYFSKPPVIAALIAASTALLGNGIIAIKLPSLLIYPATAFALYALGTRLYSTRVGFCCAGRWHCCFCCAHSNGKAGPTGWPAERSSASA